jgi:hypothetical protein
MTMTMPSPEWFGRREDCNLRGWVISALAILIAALLIAAIERWAHPPARPTSVQVDS